MLQVKEGAADHAATKAAGRLKVCIATADFWGLKAAGGTATAYHLMAAALAKHSSLEVCFCQVPPAGSHLLSLDQEPAPVWTSLVAWVLCSLRFA